MSDPPPLPPAERLANDVRFFKRLTIGYLGCAGIALIACLTLLAVIVLAFFFAVGTAVQNAKPRPMLIRPAPTASPRPSR